MSGTLDRVSIPVPGLAPGPDLAPVSSSNPQVAEMSASERQVVVVVAVAVVVVAADGMRSPVLFPMQAWSSLPLRFPSLFWADLERRNTQCTGETKERERERERRKKDDAERL